MAVRAWFSCIMLVGILFLPLAAVRECQGESLAQESIMNDSQTILADPERPVIYMAEFATGELLFIDTVTCEVTYSLYLGDGPSSLDISSDGALLYAAVCNEQQVTVVDLELRTVARTLNLEFPPFSAAVGRPDRLYVSCTNDSNWRVIDEASGTILETVTELVPAMLETSPDGSRLLVTLPGISPTKLNLYNIASDHPTLLASDSHDLGGNFIQQDADWANETLYIAEGGTYGIQPVSLTDLTKLDMLPCGPYMAGVALTRDKSVVFGLRSDPYGSDLRAYDVSDGLLLEVRDLDAGDKWLLEVAGDGSALFIVRPLQRIQLVPTISPSAPAEGAVLGYTPSLVESRYAGGLPTAEWNDMRIEADGINLTEEIAAPDLLYGQIDWFMAEGVHWVNASATWIDRIVWANWSFSIDRDDPAALRPQLLPEYPSPGDTLDYPPESLSAQLIAPYPAPVYDQASMSIDDTVLESQFSSSGIYASLPDLLPPGTHTVNARIVYDQGAANDSISWDFTLEKYQVVMPEVTMVFPEPTTEIYESPEYLEFDLSFGEPVIEVLWLNVTLGVREVDVQFVDEDTFRGAIDWELMTGTQTVRVELTWDIGTLYRSWQFSYQAPWRLVSYEDDEGFVIPIPAGWETVEDQESDGAVLELEVIGPEYYGITTDILIDTDRDASVRETTEYMENQIQAAVDGFAEAGAYAREEWTLYRDIGGQFGAVFRIALDAQSAVALTAIVVSEEHQRYWIVMLVVSTHEYGRANATFEEMMSGFVITAEPVESLSDVLMDMLIYACVGAAVAVIGGFAVRKVMRRRRHLQGPGTGQTGPVQQMAVPPPNSGFCQRCGGVQNLAYVYCNRCGAALPVPPFGQAVQDGPAGKGAS